jgi:signal transduction histidine kinase
MRERLQAIGGQLTLRTAPGAGTCIEARAASHAPP